MVEDLAKMPKGSKYVVEHYQEIVAEVPARELYGYCTALRSMTGGAGDFSYEFVRFENAPKDIQDAQIEKRKNKLTVDEE